MELFVDRMVCLQNGGCYYTQEVIDSIRQKIKYNPEGEYNDDYHIYELKNKRVFKEPKQSKRAEIGNKLKCRKNPIVRIIKR